MMKLIEKITLTMLRFLNPEFAHHLVLNLLQYKLFPKFKTHKSRLLEVNLAGLNLHNPIGLAAGFDKNAEAINTLPKIGFGFLEVGFGCSSGGHLGKDVLQLLFDVRL